MIHFVAHRGTAPENTMEAFRKCVENGISIECDVRTSKDGVPVVIHDETLMRTAGRNKFVKDVDASALRDAGVPLLKEVVSLVCSRPLSTLFVELKEYDDMLAKKTVDIVCENHAMDRCAIISFHPSVLSTVKQVSALRTGYVHGKSSTASVDDCGADMLWMDHSMISADIVQKHREKGVEVFAWTVNDTDSLQRMKRLGVHGIASDVFDFLQTRI
jgi:glycerophosphoryl diester phosphodiesterase